MQIPLTERIVKKHIDAGQKVEIGDARARGLVLRIHGPAKWNWEIRRSFHGKDHRFLLGNEWSLDEARELHIQFQLYARRGREETPTLAYSPWHALLAKRRSVKLGGHIEPPTPNKPTERLPAKPRSILWSDAAALWVTELLRTRREATAVGYRNALNVQELVPFHDRMVRDVTREDMAEAFKAIAGRGKERQAETCGVAIRGLFEFVGADAMRSTSGVIEGVMEKLKSPERSLDEDDDESENHLRVPGADDIARIMSWLDNPTSADERYRLAGKFLVYSAQRRRMVARARVADFESAGEHGGLWRLPALHRKTASVRKRKGRAVGAHVVPLPPAAWAVVLRAKALGEGSEYLFPAERARRKGDAVTTIHPDSLTHLFADIPGSDFTPHDIRRAFGTTYGNAAKLGRVLI
jgi:hypothetical protein